jgi:hypothetical protein
MRLIAGGSLALALMLNLAPVRAAHAWGDEGHQVVALVAQSFLDPAVRKKVTALLAADTDSLTAHDMASAATWADRYRDANIDNSRERTSQWHFVDIELASPSLDQACFNHPTIGPGSPASNGPADDCVVDKVKEFADELANASTDLEEQTTALKFLLHFVGDMHQPLHAADDNHDRGGNKKRVSATGFKANNLHHYWDTEFVDQLGSDAKTIASDLIGHITKDQIAQWQSGQIADWALESFQIAKADAYGQLPEPSHGGYRISDDYVTAATQDVAVQLSKAGVRLAFLLNRSLGK